MTRRLIVVTPPVLALLKSDLDCAAIETARRAGVEEPPRGGAIRGPARIIANGIPMEQFATILTNTLGERLVIDRTGLTGRFAFHLAFTPETIPQQAPPPGVPPIDPNGPRFVTALQEQLGFKIHSGRAPLKVVVIDNIERPTPD